MNTQTPTLIYQERGLGERITLSELRNGLYDLIIYQKDGEATGSSLRRRSLQDIGTLLEFVENTVICVSPSNKPWRGLQWV